MTLFGSMVLFIVVTVLSYFITGAILKIVVKNNILDHPGSRSMHEIPLPRGGGITIALLFLLCLIILWQQDYILTFQFLAFFIGATIVFMIGFIDDIKSMSVLIKGPGYYIAALLGVGLLDAGQVNLDAINYMSVIVWGMLISWMVNLYNFMDGSDGLAGMQTFLAGLTIAGIAFIFKLDVIFYPMIVMAASSCGFLFYNFPPARLFMGDSGSCFIGFVFGMTAYYSISMDLIPLQVWLILFSVFICDSGLTLILRVFTGNRWYQAHREHAYQRLILTGHSHRKVLFYFTGIFLVILLPMTWLVLSFEEIAAYIVVLCYMLLIMVWAYIQYQYRTKLG